MKRLVSLMLSFVLLSAAAPASAAFDAFLKIDGIDGESTEKVHKNWIDILSFAWGVTNAGGAVGGGAGSKPAFSPFSFTHLADSSVPHTFLAAALGTTIKDMTLDLVRPDGGKGSGQPFFQMVFEEVNISSFNMSGNTGGIAPEVAVKATYDKVTLRYRPQNASGDLGPAIEGSFDLGTNAAAAFSGNPNALIGLFEAGGSIQGGNLTFASPAPEPSTYVMMLAGLAFVFAAARRRIRAR